jgi:hypothetical protein
MKERRRRRMNVQPNTVGALSFGELMHHEHTLTPSEKVLVQAIARLTTAPGYTHMTPAEVYAMLVEQTEKIQAED